MVLKRLYSSRQSRSDQYHNGQDKLGYLNRERVLPTYLSINDKPSMEYLSEHNKINFERTLDVLSLRLAFMEKKVVHGV